MRSSTARRLLAPLLPAGLLIACAPGPKPGADSGPAGLPACDSDVAYRYAPDEQLTTFPDDHFTVADPSTPTGRRLAFDPADPALAWMPEGYHNLLGQLGTLDGFGLTPDLVLRYTLPPPDPADLQLYVVDGGALLPHPLTVRRVELGATLLVRPTRPLPPGAEVLLVHRTDPTADGCVAQPEALRAMLAGEGTLGPRAAAALGLLGWDREEVAAMVLFTTQSAEDQSLAVAAAVRADPPRLDGPMACASAGPGPVCEGTVTVADFRAADGVVPEGPVEARGAYALPVTLWTPPTPGPWPLVLCGHGLGGSRRQCGFLHERLAPLGVAVVAADAQEHGDHPMRNNGGEALDQIMALFGFTLIPPTLDALKLRDNFRASAWDRVQVLEAARAGWDVDGDGVHDVDPDQLYLAGASLGGIMGPEVLHLVPELRGAVLVVPGGGLMNLVLDSDTFGVIATAMTPADWSGDDLLRAIPMVQTLIDAGDPLVHAGALTRARAVRPGPHVALLMALDDSIVPNSSTAALAQAFEVDGVGDALYPVELVEFSADPLQANLPDGATGGLLQLAQTRPADGADPERASHDSLHESVEATALMLPFFEDALSGTAPTLSPPVAR